MPTLPTLPCPALVCAEPYHAPQTPHTLSPPAPSQHLDQPCCCGACLPITAVAVASKLPRLADATALFPSLGQKDLQRRLEPFLA